jgi:hypothetical protein
MSEEPRGASGPAGAGHPGGAEARREQQVDLPGLPEVPVTSAGAVAVGARGVP